MNENPSLNLQNVEASEHKKTLDTLENSTTNIPKTIVARWWWRQYSWSAYQLPNGLKVMSDRQMAIMVGQSKANVRNFVSANNLETVKIKIPNGIIITAKTLPTVAAYLKRLLELGNLQYHRLSLNKREWQELIATLSGNKLGHGNFLLPNPRFFHHNYQVVTATPIKIELENNIVLEVLVLPSGEYHIGYREGLICIKVNPNWLLQNSLKKAKVLTRLKLSPLVVQCQISTSEGMKQIHTLGCKDWLSVWEYFAKKGNRRAIAMLKACAFESIANRVAKVVNNGQ